jgi:hypothetical protein
VPLARTPFAYRSSIYRRAGHRLVHGWLTGAAVRLISEVNGIQTEAGTAGHVGEIGVHHGRLLILLALLRRPGENAVAVDLFEDQHLNVDKSGAGDRLRLDANLRRWVPNWNEIRIHKANSLDLDATALQSLAGGPLRLVSVDGGHTAEITAHDLRTSCESLTPGGVVILDDVFNGLFPAVSEGARRFLTDARDWRPFAIGGNKTLIAARRDAEFLQTRLAAVGRNPRSGRYLGNSVVLVGGTGSAP